MCYNEEYYAFGINSIKEMDGSEMEKKSIGKIIGRSLIAALFGLALGLAIFSSYRLSDTKIAKSYLWTDAALAEYHRAPADFHVYSLEPARYFDERGYFFALNMRYSLSLSSDYRQFQLTVRYNDAVLRQLGEDYGLGSVADADQFVYILRDENGVIYPCGASLPDEKMNLNYCRVAFENVDFSRVQQLDLEVYYKGNLEIHFFDDAKPYRSLTVYKSNWATEHYTLRKSELPNA